MKIRYAAKTDPGMKRTHNEDFYLTLDEEKLFIVADGMGGHAMGEVASKMAAETLQEFYKRTKDEDATWPYKMDRQLSYVENRLVCGIKLANWKVHESATKDPRCKGMGTTMVTCMLNGDRAYFGWVGDSRGYRLRNGVIKQMTRDHSLLEDYKEAKPDMTEEEQRNFPHKNVITRALGMRETVQVDIRPEGIEIGDVFMLCCDGLTGMIDDQRIGEIIKNADEDLEKCVTDLVDQANKNGGVDNITVIVLRTYEDEKYKEVAEKFDKKKN
ncbi:MAG: Stp1/IreP family PP2C-type Ser/Thr phosphatase [Elusimicrobia bacterium]|nr:MAG: Stp1/IreP family PP2C-type Ser/Thr phosphatase [Elusimicrobiota bacterium]